MLFFGKKEENFDNLKLLIFLNIFYDIVVVLVILMLVFFGGILVVFGLDIMFNVKLIGFGVFVLIK